jgi:hypothetical protein
MFVFVGTEVTVDVAVEVLVIDEPSEVPTKLQAPVPDVGLFPAKVNVDVLHKD